MTAVKARAGGRVSTNGQVKTRARHDRPEAPGRLEISPTVVRKLAEYAADQVADTTSMRRRLAGLDLGTHGTRASVVGTGGVVDLRLEVAVQYPAPIRRTVEELRDRVTEELARYTGTRVRRIAVTVSALVPRTRPRVE